MSFSSHTLSIFPIPRLISLRGGGLEISEHSVKYLVLEPFSRSLRRREFRVVAWGSEPLPQGAVAGGEVGDAAALREVLHTILPRMRTPFVRVSLPEQKGYIFQASFPSSPDLSLQDAVAFSLEERAPLSAGEAVFDCEQISSRGEGKGMQVNVTAFPRALVETQYAVLREAGFIPLSFEMESQAAARALSTPSDGKTRMIVDFGDTRTSITVVDKGIVCFTTSIEISGVSLSAALHKSFDVSEEEMDRLKNEQGLVAAAFGNRVAEALIGTVSRLRDEINRRFIYWHTHTDVGKEHPIEEILLIGGNANLRGLSEYLGQTMRVPVRQPNIWENVCSLDSYVPPIPRNESFRFSTVLGLALRSFEDSV